LIFCWERHNNMRPSVFVISSARHIFNICYCMFSLATGLSQRLVCRVESGNQQPTHVDHVWQADIKKGCFPFPDTAVVKRHTSVHSFVRLVEKVFLPKFEPHERSCQRPRSDSQERTNASTSQWTAFLPKVHTPTGN
jgi:hypothetical protein